MAIVLIGTSGFVYPHWRRGVFYPDGLPQREELGYFARHFRTVELNNPFYRLPRPETFREWRDRTPEDFVFAVKASRFITHVKRLKDAAQPVGTFLSHARGLGEKLGPVLFQLPPTMRADVDRLRTFLRVLPERRRYVLEVRHPTWLDAAVYDALGTCGVALCCAVGGALEVEAVPDTADFVFVRMHVGRGVEGNFTSKQLGEWAGRVADLRRSRKDVYVYFNNDWGGHAVRNALQLRTLLGIAR